ncbi:hypothetical protein K474DRAFT_1656157 [Panus rudis PR-1116 ss-1]|nr:hypothetical protein K474DRAFT_1656157 [Panus rudis PR-1116 ss-1]
MNFDNNSGGWSILAFFILLTLAENIIRNPDEEKYLRFKPTNSKIKKYVVDSKGTLEYAIALGFRPEVENFQPYYVFKKQHMTELKIGAAILRETFDHEMAKEEAVRLAKEQEKAQAAAAVEKVKKAFIDDRKSKAQQDMRERQLREARLAAAARQSGSASPPAPAKSRPMPGTGLTLSGETVPHNPPPRYETLSDDDDDDE